MRVTAKYVVWPAVVWGMLATFSPSPAAQDLVRDGKSDYQIVLGAGASPSEKTAADALQSYVNACTGAELPIVAEAEAGAPTIVLGFGAAAEVLGVTPDMEDLGEQGYVMVPKPPHLVIAGTPAAGTLYGVYDFLEDEVGVRWYAPGVTHTPKRDRIALPSKPREKRPSFAWRHTSYAWPGKDAAFMSHQRDNSGGGQADSPWGVQYAFDGQAHSYFRFVSPTEFFADHPEYFSEIGGKRRKEETQLCLTNPDVLDIVTERMLARMAERPDMRQYNFSQMDYYNFCECERCTAINEKYGTPGATQFWFVNQLAERTSKVYPDKLIGTLAYTYTEMPPKGMKMHPNVAVWLCHMYPCCDSHPIATCPRNAVFKSRAETWAAMCSHLYIWHYIVDFAHYFNPFPNLRAMAADMRFYRDIGVEGIYLQGMGHPGGGGEFSLLRPYYAMKLLWNPDCNPDAVINDFLQGYYGPAAEPIYRYITMLGDEVEHKNFHMHLYTNPAMGYLSDAIMERAAALFDEAEANVAGDPELLERVRVCRMPLTYALAFPRNGYTIDDVKTDAGSDTILRFTGPIASMDAVTEFLGRMKTHGFETIREWGGDPAQLVPLVMVLNNPMKLATIQNDTLRVDVAPILGGRALRVIDRTSGECVTAYNTKRSLYFPYCGGEETRMGGTYAAHLRGPMNVYEVASQSDRELVLETLAGDVLLRRSFTLAEDAPRLDIAVTAVNKADKAQDVHLRSHVELEMGSLRATRVSFTNRKGDAITRDMKPIIAALREGEFYKREQVPDGAWAFTGDNGFTLTQSFDDSQIDFTWLYAYPETLNELEAEVWVKPIAVEPGESATFTQRIEVRRSGQ